MVVQFNGKYVIRWDEIGVTLFEGVDQYVARAIQNTMPFTSRVEAERAAYDRSYEVRRKNNR